MDENPSVAPQAALQSQQGISRIVIPESKTIKVVRAVINIVISLGYIAEIVVVVPLTFFSVVLLGTMACDDPHSAACNSSPSLFSYLGFPIAIQALMFVSGIIFIVTIFGKQTRIKKIAHWLSALPILCLALLSVVYFILNLWG